ncbi:Caffeine resistance protein 5 [Penicillium subrubescens]|uniref:Caffeine resistance protein 5 n=1 Tax=Penicillium subrubescens TaxID=1316194 RepID=A0A1Q5TRQ1_9EURO|nr:Caffeine resistance protein 5 [Penicillium subrubescens]
MQLHCTQLAEFAGLFWDRKRWKTWRATLWLLSGITAFTTISTFFFLPETLSSNILLRRAKRLREQTGNPAYQSEAEIQSPSENLALRIVKDMGNDIKLACLDPVILFVNVHTMLVYGVLYLWFEFFPFVAFFGILVGASVSVVAYVLWLYFSYQPRVANANVVVEPEARLVPGQIGADIERWHGLVGKIISADSPVDASLFETLKPSASTSLC